MRRIGLTQGKYAIVDDRFYLRLKIFKWYALKRGKTFYAVRNAAIKRGRKRGMIFMHHAVLEMAGIARKRTTDHRDRNGLHNWLKNLRPASMAQNQYNCGARSNNTSGFKGVCRHSNGRHWQAQIAVDGVRIHLGNFLTPELASVAYVKAARKYHREFANTDAYKRT